MSHQLLNYDDNIDLNPAHPWLRSGLTPGAVWWAFTSFEHANWIPLTRLSWLLDVSLAGFAPRAFFVGNLFYHALGTVLLFEALRRMTLATGRSALVAAIFALHPLGVESVAWASERKDVLCGAAWMATLAAYAGWARHPSVLRYGLVSLLTACALLAKPMAVTLPLVLLLLDVWPLGRVNADSFATLRRTIARPLLEKLPLVALSLGSGLATIHAQRVWGAIQDLEVIPLDLRLGNAALSYWIYLGDFLWPSDLAVFYPHPGEAISYVAAGIAGAALFAASFVALRAVERRPYVTVGWSWFLVVLMPVIGIVQVGDQARADRYMYVPLVGLSLVAVWGGAEIARRVRLAAAAQGAIAVALVLALGVASAHQVRYWRDSVTLFTRALEVTEGNALAHRNVGEAALRRKDLELAEHHLSAFLRLRPGAADAHQAHAGVLLQQGRTTEALAALRRAAELDPGLEPVRASALRALAESETPADAIAALQEMEQSEPTSAELSFRLGRAYLAAERPAEAAAELERAAGLAPDLAGVHAALGQALQRLGRSREAVAAFREALRREGPTPTIENNLAWILATASDRAVRDPHEAVRLAEGAVAALGRQDAGSLDTLAAAYDAAGRRDDARAAAREALARAEVDADAAAIAAVRAHIARLEGDDAARP